MWRVVDVAEDDRVLSLSRGNLKVSDGDRELGRIPLSDIQCVLVHGHGAMLSLSLGAALADAGIPLVLCGRNHAPVALSLPVSGNFEQAARLTAQASLSLPRRKQLWRRLVMAKIASQARALEISGCAGHAGLAKFAKAVRSGDPDNVEARAARFYWRRLLGDDFRRDPDGDGLNAHLNYGYTVVRAAMARAVVGSGLTPGLGLHHRSRLNAFQLVDDLMEPFRPLVDHAVRRNWKDWTGDVTEAAKRDLARIVNGTMATVAGSSPVSRVMSTLAHSLAEVCAGEAENLAWPLDWALLTQETLDLDNQTRTQVGPAASSRPRGRVDERRLRIPGHVARGVF